MKKCTYCGKEYLDEANECAVDAQPLAQAGSQAAQNDISLLNMGWFIRLVGWAICIGSVFFAMGNKSADPPYVLPFWACFVALVGVSAAYFVARRVSEQWKSKAVRSYFSPYIVGATIWLLLFLLFGILSKIEG